MAALNRNYRNISSQHKKILEQNEQLQKELDSQREMKQWHEAEKKEMAVQAEASETKLKKTITNLKTNLKQLT